MRDIIQEVGSFVLLGVILLGVVSALSYFFPNLIETIAYYLSLRTPKY